MRETYFIVYKGILGQPLHNTTCIIQKWHYWHYNGTNTNGLIIGAVTSYRIVVSVVSAETFYKGKKGGIFWKSRE